MKKLLALEAVLVGAVILLSSGCFSYRQAELGTVLEGSQVRVHMTRQAFAALPEIPYQAGPTLAGTLVGRYGDELFLRVPIVAGPVDGTLAQQVVIPASDILGFESRELNRTRTGIAIATSVVTVVALYVTFEKGNPFASEDPEEPEEEEGATTRFWRILKFSVRLR